MIFPENYYTNLHSSESTKNNCCQKCCDGIGNIKSFAKAKPIIFSVICVTCLAIIITIIAVSVSLSKNDNDKKEWHDACSKNIYSDECLYKKMIAKQKEYPEGRKWNNDDYYDWKGGIYTRGYGCAGFAFMLSDVCFGDIKAKKLEPCPTEYKVGDVVRINSDKHSVIIIKMDSKSNIITMAEGNYNNAIHWGRNFTKPDLNSVCNYILRRIPN